MPETFSTTLPLRGDTERIIEAKMLLLLAGLSGGGFGANAYYRGHGNPNGIVTATEGSSYRDLDAEIWYRSIGDGVTANSTGTVWE